MFEFAGDYTVCRQRLRERLRQARTCSAGLRLQPRIFELTPGLECQLPEVAYLEELGGEPTALEAFLGEGAATGRVGCEHLF